MSISDSEINRIDIFTANDNPWQWDERRIYAGDILFHGPAFQAIYQLKECSKEGASAILTGTEILQQKNPNWYSSEYIIDVPLLDAGLQLAFIWNYKVLNKKSLPMKIKDILYRPIEIGDSHVSCVMSAQIINKFCAKFNLIYYLNKKTVIAKIKGLEMVVY